MKKTITASSNHCPECFTRLVSTKGIERCENTLCPCEELKDNDKALTLLEVMEVRSVLKMDEGVHCLYYALMALESAGIIDEEDVLREYTEKHKNECRARFDALPEKLKQAVSRISPTALVLSTRSSTPEHPEHT